MYKPSTTAEIPIKIDAKLQIPKCKYSPDFKNIWFSDAKAEKVVKPPHNPVTSNRDWFSLKASNFTPNPIKKPIKRHPIILTKNVLTGNSFGNV